MSIYGKIHSEALEITGGALAMGRDASKKQKLPTGQRESNDGAIQISNIRTEHSRGVTVDTELFRQQKRIILQPQSRRWRLEELF